MPDMTAAWTQLPCSAGAEGIISTFHRNCLLTNLAKQVFGVASFFPELCFKAWV